MLEDSRRISFEPRCLCIALIIDSPGRPVDDDSRHAVNDLRHMGT